MRAGQLERVIKVEVAIGLIERSLAVLRAFGRQGCEGFLLWGGVVGDDAIARVTEVVVPPQTPVRSEHGIGYFLDGETLFELNKAFLERQLVMLAQVHSHPAEAFHSEADDRYAVVSTEGGFSLVVPHFGEAPPDPTHWAVFRLRRGQWRQLRANEIRRQFVIS